METTTDDDQEPEWRKKQKEYEIKKARAKALKLKLTCSICSKKAKLNCPCGTTQYCSMDCQRIDWRDRGHRKACKKIRDERAAEAARAEAPTPPPPEEVFYGPAPRSHADEVRARIKAEHEAARARREANPEEPETTRMGSRCPVCLEAWDVNSWPRLRNCCCRQICVSCDDKISFEAPCPLCHSPPLLTHADSLAAIRRHVENEVPEAVAHLGQAYHEGMYGLVKSDKKAAKIWKRAVELGCDEACTNLGLSYMEGRGVKLDKKKGRRLFQISADRGFAVAQRNLGLYFKHEKEFGLAIKYYKLAASQGLTSAANSLGLLYADPDLEGMEFDLDEAKRWFSLAAAKGDESAIESLAIINAG
jgi:hypothetical protein